MPSFKNMLELSDSVIKRLEGDRQSLMRRELEAYLVGRCERELRQGRPWTLDFSSRDAYEQSCEVHRRRWSDAIGEFAFEAKFNPRYEPFFETDRFLARWLYIDLDEGLVARAVIACPKHASGPLPLVIAQHGIGSSPERACGLADDAGLYHGYVMSLLEAGYAVLAPSNITEAVPRERLQRLCLLMGRTLAGLEVGKIRRLLDFVVTLPQIDASRVAMWGISLGGMYTMFTTPLELRIKVAIVCAWFNDRFQKMAVSSPLYSCFLDVDEGHIWIPGWLTDGRGDAEVLAMICPRAVQIQQGHADGIGWWPLQYAEFDRAKKYYEKLGLADRIEYPEHTGGHEILVDEGLAFLDKHLT